MNITPLIRALLPLALTLGLTSAGAANKQLEEVMSHDGLAKVSVKGIDLAYTLPGATLAEYKRVKLDPVEVSFHKDWNPTRTGSRFKLSESERENIRSGVAKIVREEFERELQKGNYPVVDTAAPDVLRVRATIVNLYVNAPDVATAGMSRTYVVSAGQMTLVAELYDSETGQVLARLVDRREARDTGTMALSNSVVNRSEAAAIAARWAHILRKALDNSRAIGTPAR